MRMTLFTVEVGRRPVLVFSGRSQDAAQDLIPLIGADLRDFEACGRPIWDGEAPLSVRRSDAGDTARWQRSFRAALEDGTAGEDPDEFATFLVELDPLPAGA